MSLDAGSLFEIAIALGVLALLFQVAEVPAQAGAWVAMRQGLAGFCGQLALVALLAAAVLKWLPLWQPAGLGDLSLVQLQQAQRRFTAVAERAWWLPMALALLALGAAGVGWSVVHGVRARLLGQALTGSLLLKSLAALVALFGISAAGLQQRAAGSAAAAEAQLTRLQDLRLQLAGDAARAALVALARPLADQVPAAQDWPGLASAYWTAEPTLRTPGWPTRTEPLRPAFAARVHAAMPDRGAAALQAHAQLLQSAHRQVGDARQRLMAVVLETAFDTAVADPLRERLLSLDHPLLNELLAALLDPVVAAPLRQAAVDTALAGLQGGSLAALQQRATLAVGKLPAAARQRLRAAMARASVRLQAAPRLPLGQPAWAAVRDQLAERLRRAQADARLGGMSVQQAGRAWREVQLMWPALDRVLVSAPARRDQAELALAALLLWPGDTAGDTRPALRLALWGAAVAESQGLRTPQGDADARAGLLRWSAALPRALAQRVQERLPAEPASAAALAAHQVQAARATETTRQQRAAQAARRPPVRVR